MDEHALAVDIHGFESADFRDPQSGSIGGGENGFVFGGPNGGKEGEDFLHGEHDGKGFRPFGVGQMFDDSRLPKGGSV